VCASGRTDRPSRHKHLLLYGSVIRLGRTTPALPTADATLQLDG